MSARTSISCNSALAGRGPHAPDVIITPGSRATAAMLAAARTIPIVFVSASDPLGSGLV